MDILNYHQFFAYGNGIKYEVGYKNRYENEIQIFATLSPLYVGDHGHCYFVHIEVRKICRCILWKEGNSATKQMEWCMA